MTDMNPNEILIGPGEGETISSRDERGVEILTARERLTITWSRYSPGERGPDPHVHHEHTDAFYVLEGEMTYGVGPANQPVQMPAGGFVAVPPDVSHSFRNDGRGRGAVPQLPLAGRGIRGVHARGEGWPQRRLRQLRPA